MPKFRTLRYRFSGNIFLHKYSERTINIYFATDLLPSANSHMHVVLIAVANIVKSYLVPIRLLTFTKGGYSRDTHACARTLHVYLLTDYSYASMFAMGCRRMYLKMIKIIVHLVNIQRICGYFRTK